MIPEPITSATAPTSPPRTNAAADRSAALALALEASTVGERRVVLPSSGRAVQVPVYVRNETQWRDELPREFGGIPNKPAFALDGVPLYRELVVVRLLERAGWGAAWRKTWNGLAYWRAINEIVAPSPLAATIIDQVTRQAGYAGSWDIIAWRGRELRLLASRTAGAQQVSAYMADWLDAALRMGIPLGCFAVVEHHADRPPGAASRLAPRGTSARRASAGPIIRR